MATSDQLVDSNRGSIAMLDTTQCVPAVPFDLDSAWQFYDDASLARSPVRLACSATARWSSPTGV
jgi:hypothetical protein